MKEDYQEWIISTPEEVTFLHRCSAEGLEKVMMAGLCCKGDYDLQGSATMQPQNFEAAEGIYLNGKGYGDRVAVIRISRALWDDVRRGENKGAELMDERIGYFGENGLYLKPEFVVAGIDRSTGAVSLNPYRNGGEHGEVQ